MTKHECLEPHGYDATKGLPPDANQGAATTSTANAFDPPRLHVSTTAHFVWIRLLVFPSECEQRCRCQVKYGLEARPEPSSGEILKTQAVDHVCPSVECPEHRASDSPSSVTRDQCHLSSRNSFTFNLSEQDQEHSTIFENSFIFFNAETLV